MSRDFKAKVQSSRPFKDRRVLFLDAGFEGEVSPGDTIVVELPSGPARAQVDSVGWGSAFHADSAPLMLVVSGLGAEEPDVGAEVRAGDEA